MANCSACGSPLKPGKSFCIKCGARAGAPAGAAHSLQAQVAAEVQCPVCGAMVQAGKRFCTKCGHNMSEPVPSPSVVTPSMVTPPVVTPPTPPASAPSASPVGLILVVMVIIGVGFFALRPKPGDDGLKNRPSPIPTSQVPPGQQTSSQFTGQASGKDLLTRLYGNPPFFSIIMAGDQHQGSATSQRREVWIYPEQEAAVVFFNGEFHTGYDIKPFGQSAAQPGTLRPEQITETLSLDQLNDLMGGQPARTEKLDAGVLPDAVWYEYDNGTVAVFSQERLHTVKVMPVP